MDTNIFLPTVGRFQDSPATSAQSFPLSDMDVNALFRSSSSTSFKSTDSQPPSFNIFSQSKSNVFGSRLFHGSENNPFASTVNTNFPSKTTAEINIFSSTEPNSNLFLPTSNMPSFTTSSESSTNPFMLAMTNTMDTNISTATTAGNMFSNVPSVLPDDALNDQHSTPFGAAFSSNQQPFVPSSFEALGGVASKPFNGTTSLNSMLPGSSSSATYIPTTTEMSSNIVVVEPKSFIYDGSFTFLCFSLQIC